MKNRTFHLLFLDFFVFIFILNACCRDCNNPDSRPTICLKGLHSETSVFNNLWVDPGYYAMDDTDGDITDKVIVTGSVDSHAAGEYSLTYNVKDAAGNAAPTVERKVTVDAAAYLAGNYSVIGISNGDTSNYADEIHPSTDLLNKIFFQKFANYTSAIIYATLQGTTVTIPSQTVTCGTPPNDIPHTFQGTGTFTTSKSIAIKYSDHSTLGNFEDCAATYTKK